MRVLGRLSWRAGSLYRRDASPSTAANVAKSSPDGNEAVVALQGRLPNLVWLFRPTAGQFPAVTEQCRPKKVEAVVRAR